MFLAILIAISLQNAFTLPLIESYIQKKAIEVSTATIERISDFSSFALLERTYENRLSLDDAIKKVKKSHIEGLVGVSIYQKDKHVDDISFNYIAGFGEDVEKILLDDDLIKYLNYCKTEEVSIASYTIKTKTQTIQTYRFIRPIIYSYQDKDVLLGVSILYFDKDSIDAIIEEMVEYMRTVTIVILLLSTLFIYFIGVRFTRPILDITHASTAIANGDLDIDLNIKTNDEVEHLAYHFNLMVEGLKEKKKMQKFVSTSTMDMIKEDSKRDMILGGEYRTLTFLFSDIRGFTAMSEAKTPSEVISIVNFYLKLQSQIIRANYGDIDKFIGDEIMASFSGSNATSRAIKCAIEMQESINKENIRRSQIDETICEVGIGINRGEVIVGNIGHDDHMDFTAVGLSVNIASGLCSRAKRGEIVIEKVTYDSTKNECSVTKQAPFLMKNMKHAIDTYAILGWSVEDE